MSPKQSLEPHCLHDSLQKTEPRASLSAFFLHRPQPFSKYWMLVLLLRAQLTSSIQQANTSCLDFCTVPPTASRMERNLSPTVTTLGFRNPVLNSVWYGSDLSVAGRQHTGYKMVARTACIEGSRRQSLQSSTINLR